MIGTIGLVKFLKMSFAFQGHVLQSKKPAPSSNEFAALIKTADIWTPSELNFENWIKDLACLLIDSGAVQDDFLAHVTSVCRLRVCLDFLLSIF